MGYLITVEGGEYTGKTSLIVPSLQKILSSAGINVLVSREPGGTPRGEEIRQRIFKRLKEGASQEELAVLFNESRKIHLEDVILPFLGIDRENDGIGLLDRYLDSTMIYQGLEGGVPIKRIIELENKYAMGFYPDLTLITHFSDKKFAETLEMRSKYCKSKNDATRSQTAWDESEMETHLIRQRHYASLPEIYSKMGIQRKFAFVDASQHPFKVIKESTSRIGSFLGNEQVLLSNYQKLLREGEWKAFDEIWREQHEGRFNSAEGNHLLKEG